MARARSLRRPSSTLLTLAAICACLAVRAVAADASWRARVSAKLLSVYDAAQRGEAPSPPDGASNPSSVTGFGTATRIPHVDSQGRVQIDVHYACSIEAPVAALAAAGLSINATVAAPPLCVVEGWVAPASLAVIASFGGVTSVRVPAYVLHLHPPVSVPGPLDHSLRRGVQRGRPRTKVQSPGVSGKSIDANGVAIMRADQFVAQTRTGGAGVTVGVQSTGVASLSLIQQRGELPAVQVLLPGTQAQADYQDEGTALLEEVHAVAPSARLAFCGPHTFVEYTSCLGKLIGAGATILVDDVIFFGQDLMAADNADTQAVDQILARNPAVALFTVVGNYNGSYWEGAYAPVSLASQGLSTLTCPATGGTQTDAYVAEFDGSPSQQLEVLQAGAFPLTFAWADPAGQNGSDFDIYWSSTTDPTQSGCLSAASATDHLIATTLGLNAGTYRLYVATPDASFAGKFLKLWVGGDGLTFLSAPTSGAIVSAQAFASGAITIGAVNGSDGIGNAIESFSSLGPLRLVFPEPTDVQAPALVAPDGINVDAAGTYFAGVLFPDGNFYGTSASVPNAGAVAALLRGAFPTLSVADLVKALSSGAAQLGGSVPDDTFGYGRIDAMGALATLPAPTITALPDSTIDAGATSPAYAFTVSGTGNLRFSVASSNAVLVPPRVVAAGTPGVTISPSTCGAGTSSCTLTVMAAPGAGGTANLTVSAVDGANRAAPATMTVTVNGPSPQSVSPPAGVSPPASTASSAKGGGGALGWGEIAVLALLAGWRTIAPRNSRSRERRSSTRT